MKHFKTSDKGQMPTMDIPKEKEKEMDKEEEEERKKGKELFNDHRHTGLCSYERQRQNAWRTHVPTIEVIRKYGTLIKGKGKTTGLHLAREILRNGKECMPYLQNCASTAASEIYEIEILDNGGYRVTEIFC